MAKVYSGLEYMVCGLALMKSRRFHVEGCLACERILVLGDGNGRFLSELFASGFKGTVVSVDCSRGMIAQAKRRCIRYVDRIEWIEGKLETLSVKELGRFDCLITHYFWDVFEAERGRKLLKKTLEEVEGLSKVGMADFWASERLSGWKRMRQRGLLALLFWGFRVITRMENRKMWAMDVVMAEEGWKAVERESFGAEMVWAGWWHEDSCIEEREL